MGERGPKLTEVNWDMCTNLLRIQCTGEEIAGAMGMSYDTLERACKRDHNMKFAEYSELKRSEGKASLRRSQWKAAMDGNPTMLIWLGKQMLGQRDKVENDHTSSDGSMSPPTRIEIVAPAFNDDSED